MQRKGINNKTYCRSNQECRERGSDKVITEEHTQWLPQPRADYKARNRGYERQQRNHLDAGAVAYRNYHHHSDCEYRQEDVIMVAQRTTQYRHREVKNREDDDNGDIAKWVISFEYGHSYAKL